ncbi:MAG: hypothetical protein Q3982_03130 [Phoenicibacter congonensis]|uniref:Uncharacterized protein n=1 Tax=Phoenicibacter congonensis TaxID=1944646 RepID=A0AA43RLG0_9ACTN|nr:hypothetical protein [Phoenicibacter congonensis]
MKRMIGKLIMAYRLEYHWWFIMRYRKRMRKLYDNGESLSSPRMLRLNSKSGNHHVFVMKNEKLFEELYLS